ncbi:MAG: cobyric acid synthase [Pseudomonadota bacterium]|nr:cobyric acid synthase [Pseudomonadota bacterium]
MPATIMLQGAGSNVGKSVLVAGLCRHFSNAGLCVRPFKPQNMSNNAAVTADGGEIGRAQAMQARGCRAETSVHMNPVLLKPESETGSQVIVQGKRFGSMRAREYGSHKAELLPRVLESFDTIGRDADLVIVEGAGSPAEVNLRAGDIANMGFAVAADVPVVMVGDIDRGGVIASLVGTDAVLDEADRALIKGFLINKFRGDTSLFAEGMTIIERATGWQGVGILPWFPQARFLPAEDILDIKGKSGDARDGAPVRIAVPVLRRIANFDDLDPLAGEPDVDVVLVEAGDVIPADADLILLPGSKSTISDLVFLRAQGWDIDIAAHLRRGGMVMGLCGGYQMLGTKLDDPDGIEGPAGDTAGLGHLAVETVLAGDKRLTQVTAHANALDLPVRGYEIHMGRTGGPDCDRPFLTLDGKPEGAVSADGAVIGTYLHGIFADDGFRRGFLESLAARRGREGAFGEVDFDARVDATLDELAAHMAKSLDLDAFARIASL